MDESPLTYREARESYIQRTGTTFTYYRCPHCHLFHHSTLTHNEAKGWTEAQLNKQHQHPHAWVRVSVGVV